MMAVFWLLFGFLRKIHPSKFVYDGFNFIFSTSIEEMSIGTLKVNSLGYGLIAFVYVLAKF